MEPRGVLSPLWRQLYQAAILETDPKLLAQRVVVAERAMSDRINELDSNPDEAPSERDTLADAVATLRCLRRLADEGKVA